MSDKKSLKSISQLEKQLESSFKSKDFHHNRKPTQENVSQYSKGYKLFKSRSSMSILSNSLQTPNHNRSNSSKNTGTILQSNYKGKIVVKVSSIESKGSKGTSHVKHYIKPYIAKPKSKNSSYKLERSNKSMSFIGRSGLALKEVKKRQMNSFLDPKGETPIYEKRRNSFFVSKDMSSASHSKLNRSHSKSRTLIRVKKSGFTQGSIKLKK